MSVKTFIDTNILLYAYDLDAGIKREVARELLGRVWAEGTGVLSTQVLQEFYVNVTAKIAQPLSLSEARVVLSRYIVWPIERNGAHSILRASEIQERYRLSFWDSLIVAAAASAGAGILYTEDLNHGQVIDGIEVVNPFLFSERSQSGS